MEPDADVAVEPGQQRAIEHNVRRMSDTKLLRELWWLRQQEAQPPLRLALIAELEEEAGRRNLRVPA